MIARDAAAPRTRTGEAIWRGALRLALLAALMAPVVREWCRQAGLVWPYLVGLGFATAYFAVPVVRAFAVWRDVLDQPSVQDNPPPPREDRAG